MGGSSRIPLVFALWFTHVKAFQSPSAFWRRIIPGSSTASSSSSSSPVYSAVDRLPPLFVSIGLGPEKTDEGGEKGGPSETKELVAGVDYIIPNHEEYRTSRRSAMDAQCDAWFGALLNGTKEFGCLPRDQVVAPVKKILMTPVPLVNDKELPQDDPDYTPFVNTRLPWTPLVPAYGLEEYGLPIPRRNAETWRHFDVAGMIQRDYSIDISSDKLEELSEAQTKQYIASLQASGVWLDDDSCEARLVYVDGRFCAALSKTTNWAYDLDGGAVPEDAVPLLTRLTDGFTDELATPVPCNDQLLTSYRNLSKPNHNMGDPTSQFAINVQQGTACFAALNTIKTEGVAYVKAPANHNADMDETTVPKPVLIINAATGLAGGQGTEHDDALLKGEKGVAYHPRTLVVAQDGARLSIVQSSVDLSKPEDEKGHHQSLYNGYTQIFVQGMANVTHSYLEETGGVVTPGVERPESDYQPDEVLDRDIEAARSALKDTHLEAIDVHLMGEEASYKAAILSLGGSGHIRIALSVSLLRSRASATIRGFALSGGAQKTDIKTNIHHAAQGTTSSQVQKNMVGGRATGSFRGRIRVEQSAQQTDSQQLSRTILLSDKCRAWAVPSLEIIADDVQCSHGATVSDLSEEELFYLRSRGLDRSTARNMLMYAFADDITSSVDPALLAATTTSEDGKRLDVSLSKRVIDRMRNLVPKGDRAIKGEFQSI
ncbi:hypothetical protein ACA910_021896 [Epithemia clementina (nom. ined.)]